jgi:hypothetical protein
MVTIILLSRYGQQRDRLVLTVKYSQSNLCSMQNLIRLIIYWWSLTVLYSMTCCWLYLMTSHHFLTGISPVSGVSTTSFHYFVIKIRQLIFTTGRLPYVNPLWEWNGCQQLQMESGPTAYLAFQCTEELEIINFGHPSYNVSCGVWDRTKEYLSISSMDVVKGD